MVMRGSEYNQVSKGGKVPEKARRQGSVSSPVRGAAISKNGGEGASAKGKNHMGHGERCAEAKHHMGSK